MVSQSIFLDSQSQPLQQRNQELTRRFKRISIHTLRISSRTTKRTNLKQILRFLMLRFKEVRWIRPTNNFNKSWIQRELVTGFVLHAQTLISHSDKSAIGAGVIVTRLLQWSFRIIVSFKNSNLLGVQPSTFSLVLDLMLLKPAVRLRLFTDHIWTARWMV